MLTVRLEGANSSASAPRVICGAGVVVELDLALTVICFKALLGGMLVLLDY